MTFARAVFIFAFLMLIVGAVGARLIIGPLLFGNTGSPSYTVSARVSTATAPPATSSPRPSPTQRVAPTPTNAPTMVPTAHSTATNAIEPQPTRLVTPSKRADHVGAHARTSAGRIARVKQVKTTTMRPTASPRPSATALATLSPTATGMVTLTNYWVGSATSHPGSTIAVGYVIDNQTGAPAHVELGASVKASGQLSWATDSISDPSHDVVAVVPPGISQHVRYFTLSSGLRAGSYDIAWGLRNPSTGSRVALVAASKALRVQGIIPAP
jgi:hypothetical protein